MNLLKHELIEKYFDRGDCAYNEGHECWGTAHPGCIAYRIFQSMQEPIKKGDRYLSIDDQSAGVDEQIWNHADWHMPIHTNWLRLPSRFQKNEVEEKIKSIAHYSVPPYEAIKKELHELVALAQRK